ncbi:MAG: GIY-YIG nuclease family protein [Candidatus Nomurabacteria bacterium]|nr:MAG: GIY-YIG nuclease family protein [Candidatus Nomurabacteria bacterium]
MKNNKTKDDKFYFVYILRCADGSFYTGYTTNIDKRVKEHNGEKGITKSRLVGAKYTRSKRPVTLVHAEKFNTRSEAMRREYEIKQLSKKEKNNLITWAESN